MYTTLCRSLTETCTILTGFCRIPTETLSGLTKKHHDLQDHINKAFRISTTVSMLPDNSERLKYFASDP